MFYPNPLFSPLPPVTSFSIVVGTVDSSPKVLAHPPRLVGLITDQATLDGPDCCGGAIGRIKFAKNVLHMLFNRFDADAQ